MTLAHTNAKNITTRSRRATDSTLYVGSTHPGLADRPERIQFGHCRRDLVVRVAELVAACTVILFPHLVDRDLDRRADQFIDDLPVVEVVGPRRDEMARLSRNA